MQLSKYSLRMTTAILVFIFTDLLSSQSSETTVTFPDIEQYNKDIVATIGNVELTAQEFLFNYEFGPAFLKRRAGSKRKYLDLMIYEKLGKKYWLSYNTKEFLEEICNEFEIYSTKK